MLRRRAAARPLDAHRRPDRRRAGASTAAATRTSSARHAGRAWARCGATRTTACAASTSTLQARVEVASAGQLTGRRAPFATCSFDSQRPLHRRRATATTAARVATARPRRCWAWCSHVSDALQPLCRRRPRLRDADLQRAGLPRRRRAGPELRPAAAPTAAVRDRREGRAAAATGASNAALFQAPHHRRDRGADATPAAAAPSRTPARRARRGFELALRRPLRRGLVALAGR